MGWRLNVFFAIVAASAEVGRQLNWTRYGAEHVWAVSEMADKAEKLLPEDLKMKMTEKFDYAWNGTKNEFLNILEKMRNKAKMVNLNIFKRNGFRDDFPDYYNNSRQDEEIFKNKTG